MQTVYDLTCMFKFNARYEIGACSTQSMKTMYEFNVTTDQRLVFSGRESMPSMLSCSFVPFRRHACDRKQNISRFLCNAWALLFVCPRIRREGAISVAFVRPSVHPSRTYRIIENPKAQRVQIWKEGLETTCTPVSRSKGQRSWSPLTRPINTDTHRAPYLPYDKAYELQTWCTDEGRRPALATGAMTSKIKGRVARSRDQSEPC